MGDWLTPYQLARERSIRVGKVRAWIASGELAAVNHAATQNGRPRWRISRRALDEFDRARSNRVNLKLERSPRDTRRAVDVVEFF